MAVVLSPALAWADGGLVRASEKRGPWTITIFTSPTPPRVGVVEISVLVQQTSTGRPVLEPPIVFAIRGERLVAGEHGSNKLLQSAMIEPARPGRCEVDVHVGDEAAIRVVFEVAEPLPAWWTLGPWIAWPALVVGGFLVHRRHASRPVALSLPER